MEEGESKSGKASEIPHRVTRAIRVRKLVLDVHVSSRFLYFTDGKLTWAHYELAVLRSVCIRVPHVCFISPLI